MASATTQPTLSSIPTFPSTWTPQTTHGSANGDANGITSIPTYAPYEIGLHASNLPHGPKSLSGISLRAALLGFACGASLFLSLILAWHGSPLWRASFFLTSLSLFHFLEYYTTATYNPSAADISAFLLSQNGKAYNAAHTLAFLETVLTHSLLSYPALSLWSHTAVLAVGFGMLIIGQVTRSIAMAQAGRSFNHTVQMQRKSGHELVTHGLYGWLRHPSYFGFFWWGLGTQVVLGNAVCFLGYAVVLWRFFKGRIEKEEELLVKFFGDEYVQYRKRSWVGIPFIY